MRAYLATHLFTVIGILTSFVMMLRLKESRRTSQSTLAWMFGFVFMPVLAIPLFLLLGSRKFPSRAKGPSDKRNANEWAQAGDATPAVARVLRGSGVAPPRAGNTFELITDGEVAFSRLVDLISKAEHSIDVTMFILGHDATGRAIVDALAERAANGKRVRVILDAVGCPRSRYYAREKLEPHGAEVRLFMPLTHSPIRGRTNLRSHRKLVVLDGHTIFSGGMNFAEEYMGAGPRPGQEPRWRDVATVISGPVTGDAEAMFESDWEFVGGKRAAEPKRLGAAIDDGETAQLVPSGPDFDTDTVYDLLLTVIGAARKRLAIVTPYYVPDDDLQHALVLAARRGVQTEILVPSVSNHGLANVARRSLLRELVAAGVVVHYYPLGMVHAKAMIADDTFAYVGSPNFDMRSLFLNYENALCFYSPKSIGAVGAFIDRLIAQSTPQGPKVGEHHFIEQVARFLAPEL